MIRCLDKIYGAGPAFPPFALLAGKSSSVDHESRLRRQSARDATSAATTATSIRKDGYRL